MHCTLKRFIDFADSLSGVTENFGLMLLITCGIIMTVLLKGFQFKYFGHWTKKTLGSIFSKNTHKSEKRSISQFQALCTSLAATIGVGNIAGVAAAVTFGGPGAVFWMWIAALFGMATGYTENVLGIYFRQKNSKGEWNGGAMYYLKNGVGNIKGFKHIGNTLAKLFSAFCILASFGMGNMAQINKIVANITSYFDIKSFSNNVLYSSGELNITLYHLILGFILAFLVGIITFGGLKRTALFAEKAVPFMVVTFLFGSACVILSHSNQIFNALEAIIKNAFLPNSVRGGISGAALAKVISSGCKRGVFSNEAGLGSSVTVNASSNVSEPAVQGMWGIFEVFVDTIIVCTITALVILTSEITDLYPQTIGESNIDDSTLAAKAFETVFGTLGGKFVACSIFLFAFTTVLGWSHYGCTAAKFLFGAKADKIYKIAFVAVIVPGAVITSENAWNISDTFNSLMMLPNLVGIALLSKLAVQITNNYIDRNIKGKNIKPMLSFYRNIQNNLERELIEEKINELKKNNTGGTNEFYHKKSRRKSNTGT